MKTSLLMPETGRHGMTANARWFVLWSVIAGLATITGNQLLPLYLGAVGFESSEVVRLLSWPPLVATLTALPAGFFAHRVGSKRLLLVGVAVLMAATLTGAATTSVVWLKWMLIARTAGNTIIAVASVLVMAENSHGLQRMRLFCIVAGLSSLAYLFGPYLYMKALEGMAIVLRMASFESISHRVGQALVAGVLLVSVLPLSRIRDSRHKLAGADRSTGEMLFQKPARLARLFAPLVPIQFGSSLIVFFTFLFYADRFAVEAAPVASLFLPIILGSGILAFVLPSLSRHLSPGRLAVCFVALACLCLGVMGFAPSAGLSKTGYCLRGIWMGLASPLLTVMILNRLPSSQWGVASAMFAVAWPNSLIVPILGSLIRAVGGYDALIGVVMGCYLLASALIWFLIHRRPSDVLPDTAQLGSMV